MKTKLIKSGLLISGIFFGLLVLELGLRIFAPEPTLSRVQAFGFNCFEKGEHRWLKLGENKKCTLSSVDRAFADVEVKTNSLGLRNSEIAKKPEGTKRILFVGDSFTMGWGVKEEEAFPRVAENLLREQNLPFGVQAINGGFVAGAPSGQYIYLKLHGMDLDPDVVVVGFYIGNDITARLDVEWVKTDGNGLPVTTDSKSSYVDYTGQIRSKDLATRYKIPLLRNSHLFIFLADKLFSTVQDTDNSTEEILKPYKCLFDDQCHDLDRGKEELKKVFLAMDEMLKVKDKKLLVVVIPTNYQVNFSPLYKYGVGFPLLPSERLLPNEEFGQFFKENKIDYLDLYPYFSEAKQRTYFLQDEHWNADGHLLAAEAIADKLVKILGK